MLILLSPAKSLNQSAIIPPVKSTIPALLDDSKKLIDKLKKLPSKDLEKLMSISPKLAELNWQRFQDFSLPFHSGNSKPALFLFDGDVYRAMTIADYDKKDLTFSQNHLRILSGLYGILKPLDLIQPYRLEMGTNTKNILKKTLPQFWQEKIVELLNNDLKSELDQTVVNLASQEYFSAVPGKKINGRVVNIIFKEKKGNSYQTIGLFAKKARGLMADFIIKNKIDKSEKIKNFAIAGYSFRKEFSDYSNWHFYR